MRSDVKESRTAGPIQSSLMGRVRRPISDRRNRTEKKRRKKGVYSGYWRSISSVTAFNQIELVSDWIDCNDIVDHQLRVEKLTFPRIQNDVIISQSSSFGRSVSPVTLLTAAR